MFYWLDRVVENFLLKNIAGRDVVSTETYVAQKSLWCFLISELIVNKFCHTGHDTSQVIITQFTAIYKK